MAVIRQIQVEQAVADRIDMLNQPGLFLSSMPNNFLELMREELANTAQVNQEVYQFSLDVILQKLSVFEKQAELVSSLHFLFETIPYELRLGLYSYMGSTKLAAFQVICRRLDPQYNPPWKDLFLGDLNSLLLHLEAMLSEINQLGMSSPLVIEFLSTLANGPGL